MLKPVPSDSDAADIARKLILAAGYKRVRRKHLQAIAAWIIHHMTER